VDDLSIRYDAAGQEAVLSWTAPANDRDYDPADRYEIRYSYSSPLIWDLSAPVADPPEPALPGTIQYHSIPLPERGKTLYAALRSFDAQGNISLLSNIAFVRIYGSGLEGRCLEPVSGSPVSGLAVAVTAGCERRFYSDADGRFNLVDLADGTVNVSLRSGISGTLFHNYNRPIRLTGDAAIDCYVIEYQATDIPAGVNVLSLFETAARISPGAPVFKKWRSYPIKVYVPPFFHNGLDFEDIARDAVNHWMNRTGLQIFLFVDAPPDTGVTMFFKTAAEMGTHVGLTRHSEDDEGYPLKSDVDIVDKFVTRENLWVVVLHEMGHTIRLGHLPAGYLMHGSLQDMALDITGDEVRVTQLYVALPNLHDMSHYDVSAPPSR